MLGWRVILVQWTLVLSGEELVTNETDCFLTLILDMVATLVFDFCCGANEQISMGIWNCRCSLYTNECATRLGIFFVFSVFQILFLVESLV